MKRFIVLLLLAGIAMGIAAQNEPFRQEGIASWYGEEFAGRPTASGEIFNPELYTAAHPNLPFGTVLIVTNTQNKRQVTVRVNDRGPFVAARIIDLSTAAAIALDMISTGTAPVLVEQVANISLGPLSGTAVLQTQQTTVQAAVPPVIPTVLPAEVSAEIPTEVPAAQVELAAAEIPAQIPQAPHVSNIPQPEQLSNPVPAARILGGIPPAGSSATYRLQVGAYKVPRNALETFNKLKNAGLNPEYEQNEDLYRVVLAGLKAEEIQAIAQTLGISGFSEAILREEKD